MARPERWFADTNVLIYAFDTRAPRKHQTALSLLESSVGEMVLSTQVLGEFFHTATRTLGMATADAQGLISQLRPRAEVSIDAALVEAAINLFAARSLTAAAARAGCPRLVTEDLDAGEIIAGVQIVNPFA